MRKLINQLIEKYKNASDEVKEYYEAMFEIIIIIASAIILPITLYIACVYQGR